MADAFRDDPSGRSASRDPASTISDNDHHAVRDMVNHEAVLRQLGAAEAGGAGGDREGQHERLLATVVGHEPNQAEGDLLPEHARTSNRESR